MKGKPKKVLVVGGSGHARVLVDTLQIQGREIVGIADPKFKVGIKLLGISVLGGDEVVEGLLPEDVDLVNGIGVLPGSSSRWRVAKSLRERGFDWTTVVHPSAFKSASAQVETGVQVMAGAILQTGVKIGRDAVINTGATVDHDCIIGEECWVSPGAILCGGVQLGSQAYIGAGAIILQNITIGSGVLVTAGSVIRNDILEVDSVGVE